MSLLIECMGWIGAAAYLSGYGLLSMKKVTAESPLFHGLNLLGGTMLVVNGLHNDAYPAAATNAVWIVLTLIAMTLNKRKKHAQRPAEVIA